MWPLSARDRDPALVRRVASLVEAVPDADGRLPRNGDEYVIALDLPGVSPDAIDVDVERNILTVKAERRPLPKGDDVQTELSERPLGVLSRHVVPADTLDVENIRADDDAGVLTLRIPIAERAKPRKISIRAGDTAHERISG